MVRIDGVVHLLIKKGVFPHELCFDSIWQIKIAWNYSSIIKLPSLREMIQSECQCIYYKRGNFCRISSLKEQAAFGLGWCQSDDPWMTDRCCLSGSKTHKNRYGKCDSNRDHYISQLEDLPTCQVPSRDSIRDLFNLRWRSPFQPLSLGPRELTIPELPGAFAGFV